MHVLYRRRRSGGATGPERYFIGGKIIAAKAPAREGTRLRRRSQRLILIGAGLGLLTLAAALTLNGLSDSVEFFVPPSEVDAEARPGQLVRLGGLVAAGSVRRDETGALLFDVTDGAGVKTVRYDGDPPDLFREGQGVVATGRYQPGTVFEADRVLARHDETYMPREAQEALERAGHWKGGAPAVYPAVEPGT